VQVVPLFRDGQTLLGTTVIYEDVTEYRLLQHELEFANRQLETAYEELQSTNEDLETMNEELQSMNDELHTANEELRTSTEEVASLNQFMTGVLGSFRAGVVVVDPDLRVLVWNAAAEELWGVREDEVIGQYLVDLDIGLPMSQLHPLLRRQIAGDGPPHDTVELDAVDRRGRPVHIRGTVSSFQQLPGERGGAVVLMDPTGG
jgi:two-component system CheB/CheR fusion protein